MPVLVQVIDVLWIYCIYRHFRRDFRHLEKHIACKIAAFQDQLEVQPLRSRTIQSSKIKAELKELQHFAVTLNLSSKTQDSDIDSVSIKSAPRSYYSSLSNHIDNSSNSVVSGLPPTMNDAESLSNGMICFFLKQNARKTSKALACVLCSRVLT